MSAKHTAGPWTIADDHAVGIVDGVENLYLVVGPALVDATPLDDPEVEANARLIAAAPDLLAALEECITDEGACAFQNRVYAHKRLRYITELARAAIAAAKGEA